MIEPLDHSDSCQRHCMTNELNSVEPSNAEGWSEEISRAISEQREQLRQRQQKSSAHLDNVEQRVSAELHSLLARGQQVDGVDEHHLNKAPWEQISQQLAAHQAQFEQRFQELAEGHRQFADELRERPHTLDARREQIAECPVTQQHNDSAQEMLAREKQELDLQRAELQNSRHQQQTEAQRLAELKATLAATTAELEGRRSELDTRQQTLEQREAAEQSLVDQDNAVEKARQELQTLEVEVENLRHSEPLPGQESLLEQISDLRAARDELLESQGEGTDREETAALQMQLEAALAETRELADENARLSAQLNTTDGDEGAHGVALDWEAQKRRLLSQLETEFDVETDADRKDRLTVEGAIKVTDRIVVERDQEIAELRMLLDQQSGNLEQVAVSAAAIADTLDQDEIIREERERVRQIKEEMHEKLRQTELDLSLERAKLARERVELDEKARMFARPDEGVGEKKTHSSWKSFLGIKADE